MSIEEIVDKFRKHPHYMNSGSGKMSRRFKCTKEDIFKAREIVRSQSYKFPKILLLDIETVPCKAAIYQKQVKKAFISSDQILSEWFILSFSYKWLGEEKIYGDILDPEEVKEEDDYRLVDTLWNLLDTCDICIAHNAQGFDVPNINVRLLIHGFVPPSFYKIIDTLRVAQSQFGFTHNSLDAICTVLGIGSKTYTNFKLWKDCLNGEPDALKYMLEYNKHDVVILEQVYLRLRPWIKNHPNVGLYMEKDVCPHCGSSDIKFTDKLFHTHTISYPIYRCTNCGANIKQRTRNKEKVVPNFTSIPGR